MHGHTYLPFVPMQQGRPVMTQSMWGWLVWFPALFLVQIWVIGGGGPGQGLPQAWALCCGVVAEMDRILE